MPNSIFMGVPGANPSGMQAPTPVVAGTQPSATPLGAGSNPLLPNFPAGTSAPPPTFPANTGGSDPNSTLTALSGLNPAPSGLGVDPGWANAVKKGFHSAGFPSAIADLLTHFLSSGAGFNPQVAQAMLAALQPGVQRGQANIMEQFGSQGLRDSSSAAIGLGDFNSQVTLDEGQILSQMYEQSVQDYMTVLMAGRKPASQQGGVGGMLGGILGGSGNFMSGLSALGIGAGGAGAAGAAAGGTDAMATLAEIGMVGL